MAMTDTQGDAHFSIEWLLERLNASEEDCMASARHFARRAAYQEWRRRIPWRFVPGPIRARVYLRARQEYREAFMKAWLSAFSSRIDRPPIMARESAGSVIRARLDYVGALTKAVTALVDPEDPVSVEATRAAAASWRLWRDTPPPAGAPAHLIILGE